MAPEQRSLLFRFAPLCLGLVAVAVLAIGIWLQMQVNAQQAAQARAYLAGPPPVVALEAFEPARHTGAQAEARVTATLDLAAARPLAPLTDGGPSALAVPLLAASDPGAPLGLALFVMPDPALITSSGLQAIAGTGGARGPMLTLNGHFGPAGPWAAPLAAAGLQEAAAGIVIHPFVEGRRAAILPSDYGQSLVFDTFSQIGGAVAVLALLLFALGSRSSSAALGATPVAIRPVEGVVVAEMTAFDAKAPDHAPVPSRRSAARRVLIGVALALAVVALFLAAPDVAQRAGLTEGAMVPGDLGAWASGRWQAALSGDLKSILVLVFAGLGVAALAAKLGRDALSGGRSPA